MGPFIDQTIHTGNLAQKVNLLESTFVLMTLTNDKSSKIIKSLSIGKLQNTLADSWFSL